MLKVIYFNSDNKFGVYQIIKTLKFILKKKIILNNSNNIFDLFFFKPDITHIHGCWRPMLFFAFFVSKILKIKIIISPHGMLDPVSLSTKKIKKNIAWFLYQKFILLKSELIIVNSDLEKRNVLKKINEKVNIIVIPHTIKVKKIIFKKKKLNSNLSFVFFSRIHPIKNLHKLINIWHGNNFLKNYNLYIYGKIEHNKYYNTFSEKISRSNNIIYKGEISKNIPQKLSEYDVLIHPSSSENFGLVILEALNAGLYTLINKQLKWKIIKKNGYSLSININSYEIVESIKFLNKNKKKIRSVKFRNNILKFLKKNYDLEKISARYTNNYYKIYPKT